MTLNYLSFIIYQCMLHAASSEFSLYRYKSLKASIHSHTAKLQLDLIQHSCPHNDIGDRVGVAVGGRTAILQVSISILSHLAWDADGGTAVSHSGRKVVDRGGFMQTCQAALVVLASAWVIGADVHGMAFR